MPYEYMQFIIIITVCMAGRRVYDICVRLNSVLRARSYRVFCASSSAPCVSGSQISRRDFWVIWLPILTLNKTAFLLSATPPSSHLPPSSSMLSSLPHTHIHTIFSDHHLEMNYFCERPSTFLSARESRLLLSINIFGDLMSWPGFLSVAN